MVHLGEDTVFPKPDVLQVVKGVYFCVQVDLTLNLKERKTGGLSAGGGISAQVLPMQHMNFPCGCLLQKTLVNAPRGDAISAKGVVNPEKSHSDLILLPAIDIIPNVNCYILGSLSYRRM